MFILLHGTIYFCCLFTTVPIPAIKYKDVCLQFLNEFQGDAQQLLLLWQTLRHGSISGLHDHEATYRGVALYKCCGKQYYSKANYVRQRWLV